LLTAPLIESVMLLLQAIESVKQTPAYRNRLKALEFERTGGISSKKKGHKQMDK
jgi:DnaJ family protein C protein 25